MIRWWVNGLGYRWGGKLALGANPKFWNYAAFQLFCILLKMVNNAYTNSMGAPKKPKLKQSCPQIISIRLAILLVRLARQEACKIFVFFFWEYLIGPQSHHIHLPWFVYEDRLEHTSRVVQIPLHVLVGNGLMIHAAEETAYPVEIKKTLVLFV